MVKMADPTPSMDDRLEIATNEASIVGTSIISKKRQKLWGPKGGRDSTDATKAVINKEPEETSVSPQEHGHAFAEKEDLTTAANSSQLATKPDKMNSNQGYIELKSNVFALFLRDPVAWRAHTAASARADWEIHKRARGQKKPRATSQANIKADVKKHSEKKDLNADRQAKKSNEAKTNSRAKRIVKKAKDTADDHTEADIDFQTFRTWQSAEIQKAEAAGHVNKWVACGVPDCLEMFNSQDTSGDMIQCEGPDCGLWWHYDCIGFPRNHTFPCLCRENITLDQEEASVEDELQPKPELDAPAPTSLKSADGSRENPFVID